MKKHLLMTCAVTATMLLPVSPVMAQIGRMPGVIDRPTPEAEKLPARKEGESLQGRPEAARKKPGANERVAKIDRFEFSGQDILSESELQEIVSPYVGKVITKGDLEEIKYNIVKAHFDRGYILVRAVTPPQDVSKGVMKIEVYEAEVGEVRYDNQAGIPQTVLDGMRWAHVDSGDVFYEKAAESLVNDLNDLQNVGASATLVPGRQFNTTDIVIETGARDEDVQRFRIDDYGAKLTGRLVTDLHLEKGNILGLGEKFYTDLRRTDDDLYSVALGTNMPTGISNLVLEVNALHSENNIVHRLKALDASGKTDALNVAFSSNLINMRNQRLSLRFGLDARTHESFLSDVTDTKDDIRQAFITPSYLYRDTDAVYYAAATLKRGVDVFGANEKGDALATRVAGEPDAWIFQPVLFANVRSPISDGDFRMLATGQVASNTLLSSDLFVLGGYGSVRGFEPAQEVGESGFSFSFQYNHNLPSFHEAVQLRGGPFLDGGAVYNRIDFTSTDSHLYSAGLSLEATSEWLEMGGTTFKFDWAHPLGGYRAAVVDDNSFYFRLAQDF